MIFTIFYFTDSSDTLYSLCNSRRICTHIRRSWQSGVNNNPNGYVDGDLRQEARFNYPFGIHYDEVNKIFYIGDIENYRIRNIAKDE